MTKLTTGSVCLTCVIVGLFGWFASAQDASERHRSHDAPGRRDDAPKKQPPVHPLDSFTIEPPDVIVVDVLEALPGRPIAGERLVRPDGKISLGFYGELYVAGLTPVEAKDAIVLHLRKFVKDDVLGLVRYDPGTNEPIRKPEGQLDLIAPRETDRVSVQVKLYNSKNYYIQGAVLIPGRLPITGNDTILDAINYAGGLGPDADHDHVVLYRKSSDGTLRKLAVDIDQVMMGDDPTTNYQLLPGDRLVVPKRQSAEPEPEPLKPPAEKIPTVSQSKPRSPAERLAADPHTLEQIEGRLAALERKLDRILTALDRGRHGANP